MKNLSINMVSSIFKFDLRSMAATRIALAMIIIIDLIIRGTQLEAHYTDFGILPRNALLELSWEKWFFSFHLINGSYYFQLLLFLLAAFFALMLLVGYRTRFSTVISWIFLLSLHARNPMILQGGDVLLRILLFWGMFIPWGARYSVDSALKPSIKKSENEIYSLGAFAFVVQIALMYICTSILKSGDEWQKDYTAIYYSLSIEQMRLWLGTVIYQFPELMKFITFSTIWLELLGPILFFIPFKKDIFRSAGIVIFTSFQIGIFSTLRVGLFPFISIGSMFIMIPSVFWDRMPCLLSSNRKIQLESFLRYRLFPEKVDYRNRNENVKNPRYVKALAAFFLCYVVFWNLITINFPGLKMIKQIEWIAPALRIDQKWEMFAPFPFKDDGWYVIPGILRNGREVDVFRDGREVSWDKPMNQIQDYKIYRWRKYMRTIWLKVNKDHRLHYGRYLCRKWNRDSSYENQLMRFNIYYMKEENLPDYKTGEVEKVHLWGEHYCFK